MEGEMSAPLKLRAIDDDDLAVLSACLQDALVPVHDMRYLADENRFVLVANRFCWEKLPATSLDPAAGKDPSGPFERVHCGISIENVKRVRARGFTPGDPADAEKLFEVLTMMADDGGSGLTLVFAGGPAVHLEVDGIEIIAQDVGEPWPTLWRPHHPFDDDGN
jgi:hypothetical protein